MITIDQSDLREAVTAIVLALGAPDEVATVVARSLVGANLRGHDSHGVRLLPEKYVPEIDEGKIEPPAEPTITQESEAGVIIDGRWSFGQFAAKTAVDRAITMGKERGIGAVGLHRVSHIGRVGELAEHAADDEVALIAFVSNPGSQWVAPPGSATRRFSTNPVAIGIPGYDVLEFPIVIDMATGQVARNRIAERAAEGRPLPEGWVIAPSGISVTEPERFLTEGEGSILPLGGTVSGYKGFGLAVVTELLAAAMSDGSVSGEAEPTWGNHIGLVTIDLDRFTSRGAMQSRIATLADYIRETPWDPEVPSGGAVGTHGLLPGEAEFRTMTDRRRSGIPLPEADMKALRTLACTVGTSDDVVSLFER